MEFLQLRYFCEAADMLNISRAAKIYGVPASGVSSSIKRLEQELGVELFYRYSNKIRLTEEGIIFYEEARSILDALDRAVRRMESASGIGGKITLCVMACDRLAEAAIGAFKKEYPEVGFEVYQDSKKIGWADFYISDERYYIRGCKKAHFLEENLVLAAPKAHPALGAETIDLSLLKGEPFVCTNAGTGIYHQLSSICFDSGFIPNIAMTAPTVKDAIRFVADGYGVGIFPESEVRGTERLSYRTLENYKRNVCVFYEEPRLRSQINKLFFQKLLEVGASYRNGNPE